MRDGMRAVVLGAILGLGTVSAAHAQSGWPSDWRPFVRLGYEITVQRYQDPIIEGGRLVDPGVLLDSRRLANEHVGSGSVVTRDGLILTNFHVANVAMKPSLQLSQDRRLIARITPVNPGVMLVYELDARDPLRAPRLQYRARYLAGHEDLDVAVLKIFARSDGTPLARTDFAAVTLGNPYAIGLGEPLHIIGYPGKGGATVTPTLTNFSGYMAGGNGIKDGVFKTLSSISGGNSGGAALYQGRHVGVPSSGTISGRGAELGFIHPVTWAAHIFAVVALRDGQEVPVIDRRWVESEHNPDITRSQVFLGGKVVSAFTSKPVGGARVFFHRRDRTFDQIVALDRQVALVIAANQVRRMLRGGLSLQDVAERTRLSVEQVRQLAAIKLDESAWPDDLKRMAEGEFFYRQSRTDNDGFFMVAAPRGQRLKLVAAAPQFRQLHDERDSGEGLFANVGPIQMLQLQVAPSTPGPFPSGPGRGSPFPMPGIRR